MKKLFLIFLLFASIASAQQNVDTIAAVTSTVILQPQAASNSIHLTLSGTWVGTLAFEYLPFNSSTYAALTCTNETSFATATGATVNGNFACLNINFTAVRVRSSAWTSGTATISWRATSNGALTGLIFGGGSGGTIGTVNQGTASATEQWLVNCVTGCSAATSAADDASIPAGSTNTNANSLTMMYNGSAWIRSTGDASNGLDVDVTRLPTLTIDSITNPVTVATHAVSQSGTWTVQPGNTANTTAWLVTGTGGTFPATQSGTWNVTNVSGTVSLPTGASTSAKQPALGTAGSASTDVISVQGIASGTNLNVNCAVGCSGSSVIDNDDGTIAAGQTGIALNLGLNQVFDGTNWKRFTVGTAGTASTQVLSVQGIASGTTLHVTCDSGCSSSTAPADNSAFTAGTTSSSPISGFYQATPTSLTDGRIGAVGVTATRAIRASLESASGTPWTPSVDYTHDTTLGTITSVTGPAIMHRASAAAPADVSADGDAVLGWSLRNGSQVVNLAAGGTLITSSGANLNTNTAQINGVTTLMGNGTTGTGSQRVTIASDNTAFTVNLGTAGSDPFGANADAASATGSISAKLRFIAGTGIPITGTVTVGSHAVTNAGTFVVQENGTVSGCYLVSAASTNSTSCKGSAGNVFGIRLVNTTATLYYLRLYNTAAAPTCSSATGFIETIPVPASTTGAGVVALMQKPIAYGTGVGFCFTGGSSSTDNTNAATGVFGAILYN